MEKIALIDDEPVFLDIYSKTLGKKYEIVTAMDGEGGLELVEREKPALVLVDIRMPKMDGLEMIRQMKDKGLMNMPVIVLTNLVEDEKVSQAIELGVKDYIAKEDTTAAEILKKVEQVLESRAKEKSEKKV